MTTKQKRAIAALLTASTKQEAARAAGISYATLRRWLAEDADFQQAYNDELQGVIERAAVLARQGMTEAVTALREIVADGETAQNTKVAAARTILESGAKIIEMQSFEARLAALEKTMEDSEL